MKHFRNLFRLCPKPCHPLAVYSNQSPMHFWRYSNGKCLKVILNKTEIRIRVNPVCTKAWCEDIWKKFKYFKAICEVQCEAPCFLTHGISKHQVFPRDKFTPKQFRTRPVLHKIKFSHSNGKHTLNLETKLKRSV